MSDMSNLYKAYAAVHDDKARENLTDQRDEISEMTLTQLTDVDLYEIAEEIVEGLFAEGRGVSESEGLVQSTLAEAAAEGNESNVRIDKITRLEEAFVKAFAKVNEAAPVNAVETFMKYRDSKPLVEKWYDRVNHEHGNEKIHQSVVAEDRKVVLTGLEKMIDEMSGGLKVTSEATYGGQSLAKREKDDDAFGSPNPKRKKYVVTKADERAGTEASKRYKAGNPAYTKEQIELINSLEESGKFTDEEIETILEKEVKVKDTYKTVAAIVDYDRAKKGSEDATYDSDHGKKKQAKKERDYAAWERSKMKKDDPNWKNKKYHTGMHGEEVEGLGKSELEEEDKDLKKRAQFHTSRKEFKAYQQKKELKYWKTKKKNPVKAPNQQLKGLSNYVEGLEVVSEKDLNAKERRALPDSDFALPGKGEGPQGKQAGSYPIPDKTHARMALAMVAKHGTSAEKATVRAKVEKKFPGIKVSEEVQQLVDSQKFSQEEILRLISD